MFSEGVEGCVLGILAPVGNWVINKKRLVDLSKRLNSLMRMHCSTNAIVDKRGADISPLLYGLFSTKAIDISN